MITLNPRFMGSKVQRFFYSSYDMKAFNGTFGEPQNPQHLQKLFQPVTTSGISSNQQLTTSNKKDVIPSWIE